MKDLRGIISQIEEGLGSNGSSEEAAAIFAVLRDRGLVEFDQHDGFTLRTLPYDGDDTWWAGVYGDADLPDNRAAGAEYLSRCRRS